MKVFTCPVYYLYMCSIFNKQDKKEFKHRNEAVVRIIIFREIIAILLSFP